MTNDLPFAPPVGFSADGQTVYFAPCWAPADGMPCVSKRSVDGGVTWSAIDINSGGKTVFNIAGLPPNNQRWGQRRGRPFALLTRGLGPEASTHPSTLPVRVSVPC